MDYLQQERKLPDTLYAIDDFSLVYIIELQSFRQRVVSPTVSSPTSLVDSPTSRGQFANDVSRSVRQHVFILSRKVERVHEIQRGGQDIQLA